MRNLSISEEKVNSLAAGLFIVGLALLWYIEYPDLWAGLLLNLGIVLFVRQLLVNRLLDLLFIVIVFGGSYAADYFAYYPGILIPILLAIGAVYIICEQAVLYWAKRHAKQEKKEQPSPKDEPQKAEPRWPGSKP